MARRGQSQAPDPGADSRSAGFPPTPSPTHPLPAYTIVMYTAPPLLKEKLPRLPWPGVADHKPPILGLTHGAPGSPYPQPHPHPPISLVSPPSRTSQSTMFLALLFKCRLRVFQKKITLTQEMGYWGRTRFCININGGGGQCPSCALAWAHSCPAKFFLSWWRSSGCLHIGTANGDGTACCITATTTATTTATPTAPATATATASVAATTTA